MSHAIDTYGPTQPLQVLVTELNKLYHQHEAASYERSHPEIFDQLPAIWGEMVAVLSDHLPQERLHILDLGCGTGFEARQCLARLGDRIERIVCYDPSPEMLHRCRSSLAGYSGRTEFLEDLSEAGTERGQFNVLLTNSVLHHMVDPVSSIHGILPLLSSNAIWLCGHEPSRRFLRNPACRAALESFRAEDRWRRFVSPRRCARRVLRWFGCAELPQDYAARRAVELSLFKCRPPARLVSQLVDYHVVADESQHAQSIGLDFSELQTAFAGEWELAWRRTYSFLGPYYAGGLAGRWRVAERRLAKEYPDDGGNCSLVWFRRAGAA